MVDYIGNIKPEVRSLRRYSLACDRASVKMNQNENPFDLPLSIKEEVTRRLLQRKWSRYPEFVPVSLLERLSAFSGWPADGLLAGNGSNELIQALLMVTLSRGKTMLLCEPTFTLYRQIGIVLGASVESVSLTAELQFNSLGLRHTIQRIRPDVTIICSPNNPTGSVIGIDDLADLLSESEGLIAIDEAYHEFAQTSVVSLLREFKNLILFRTFSKAMGLAGMRVGYLLAAPELVGEISKAVLPYNLNVFSQTAAEVAVEMYETDLQPFILKIVNERDRLFVELEKIDGLAPVKSHGNFMVVRSQIKPQRVFQELLKRDVLIRDVSTYPMLSEHFRVSVGTPEENDLLIDALKQIFS